MKKYEIAAEEYTAVVKARKATQNKRIARRLQVKELRYERKTSKEIAMKLDMNWMYISEIVKQFKTQGLEEFSSGKRGRPPKESKLKSRWRVEYKQNADLELAADVAASLYSGA